MIFKISKGFEDNLKIAEWNSIINLIHKLLIFQQNKIILQQNIIQVNQIIIYNISKDMNKFQEV